MTLSEEPTMVEEAKEDLVVMDELDEIFEPEHRKEMIRKAQVLAKKKQAKNERELWMNTMPEEHRSYTYSPKLFERQVGKMGLKNIEKFIDDNSKYTFLVVRGSLGTGKTTLACSLGTELISQYEGFNSAAFITAASLGREISSWNAFGEAEDPVKKYSRVDLLVIDDVGARNDARTALQEQRITDIIDHRWAHQKSTMITTNMPIRGDQHSDGLYEWFGDIAWDRIQHRCIIVEFAGESRRNT